MLIESDGMQMAWLKKQDHIENEMVNEPAVSGWPWHKTGLFKQQFQMIISASLPPSLSSVSPFILYPLFSLSPFFISPLPCFLSLSPFSSPFSQILPKIRVQSNYHDFEKSKYIVLLSNCLLV